MGFKVFFFEWFLVVLATKEKKLATVLLPKKTLSLLVLRTTENALFVSDHFDKAKNHRKKPSNSLYKEDKEARTWP